MKNHFRFFLIAIAIVNGQCVNGQSFESFPPSIPQSLKIHHSNKSIRLSSGVHLEYAEQGSISGQPVIFLHGYGDSWKSFSQVLPLLPESIHAYSISQRGHGDSDRPQEGYYPEDFASDLADFMRGLDIQSAVIVGHSMGATVAQRFALDYPFLTKAVVLVSSFASFKTNPGIAELQAIINKIDDPVDSIFVTEFQKSTLSNPVEPSAFQTYVNESMKVPARVWKAVAKDALTVDYSKDLKELTLPTLIIWGDKDFFCPRSDQDILATSISKSTLLIYQGIGHAIHWENPERFTRDMLKFIDKINGQNKEDGITNLDLKFLSHSFY